MLKFSDDGYVLSYQILNDIALRGYPLGEILGWVGSSYRKWPDLTGEMIKLATSKFKCILKQDKKKILAELKISLSSLEPLEAVNEVIKIIEYLKALGLADGYYRDEKNIYIVTDYKTHSRVTGIKEGRIQGLNYFGEIPDVFIPHYGISLVELPKSFTVCDRFMGWFDDNPDIALESQELIEKLTLLKLCGPFRTMARFEQDLWRLHFKQVKSKFVNPLINLETLDLFKSTCIILSGNIDEDFEKIYDFLVPKIIDEDQWKKFYRIYPGSNEPDKVKVKRLVQGNEKFTDWFITQLGKQGVI